MQSHLFCCPIRALFKINSIKLPEQIPFNNEKILLHPRHCCHRVKLLCSTYLYVYYLYYGYDAAYNHHDLDVYFMLTNMRFCKTVCDAPIKTTIDNNNNNRIKSKCAVAMHAPKCIL